MGNTSSTSERRRTYSDYQYQQSSGRPKSTRSRYQTMGNTSWTSRTWGPYSDYQYQQGLGRPTPTYSRHTGAELGSYTHNSQAGSVYIGRTRLAEVRGISSYLRSVTVKPRTIYRKFNDLHGIDTAAITNQV